MNQGGLSRRTFLACGAAAMASSAAERGDTDFQIACMTLAYGAYPVERALQGIASAGYRYVAWGPNHRREGAPKPEPLLPEGAPASAARDLARRSRDAGLEPLLMFAVAYPEKDGSGDIYKRRIEQAHAAGIPWVLAFGSPKGTPEDLRLWLKNLAGVGAAARAAGVTIAMKQHGGVTATGEMCARAVRELNDPGFAMFYDAGNTWWYAKTDPIADIATCADMVRGFAIKDYRELPTRTTCGPGLGTVDHYRLLLPVAKSGRKMPLACETIFEPGVPRPETPEGVDQLARRTREYLEVVTRGVRAMA